MTTKQWIGIEEAATKYQVSTRRIITDGRNSVRDS